MALVGYARVSTEEQATARLRPGDALVVVSLGRLARSLSHLLEVVEGLQARGVHFRSLRDPVDTSSPQGLFTLQVLGAAAQLERALVRERTRGGMRAAAARGGRPPGNPGLRAGDPAGRRKASEARRASYLAGLLAGLDVWLPQVRRLWADGRPWDGIVRYLNARRPAAGPGGGAEGAGAGRPWTQERLVRAVRRLAAEGLAEPALLAPARPAPPPDRLPAVVAGIVRSDPGATLRAIGARLEAIREPPPRGGARWAPGSVAHVLARARRAGLLPEDAGPGLPAAAGEVLARFPALGVGALAAFGGLRREQEARCFLVDGAGELPVPAGSLLITRTSFLRCAEES